MGSLKKTCEATVSLIRQNLPHYAEGPIIKGFGRGSSELGFPTANFDENVIDALPEQLIGGIYWGYAQVSYIIPGFLINI